MMIGPLLARMGRAVIAKPGGDKIGRRRLDTHFLGFEKLGAKFNRIEGRDVYEIAAQKLKGNYMLLDEALPRVPLPSITLPVNPTSSSCVRC